MTCIEDKVPVQQRRDAAEAHIVGVCASSPLHSRFGLSPMARQMTPVSSARPSNSFGIDLCHELTFLIAGSDQETGNAMNLLHRVKSDLPTCQQLIVLAPVNQGVVPKRCRPMPEQWS